MGPRRQLRPFPRGETCADCNARQYYTESGQRFCKNGHRVEGYVQLDGDEEGDNFGQATSVTRKKKEAKAKRTKQLSGIRLNSLYLICLQFVLGKQIAWLVKNKGVKRELGTVCRDLWDLRIRKFAGEGEDSNKKRYASGDPQSSGSQPSGSDSKLAMHSSQTETGVSSDEGSGTSSGKRRRARMVEDWSSKNWTLPGPVDTLAVLYLGCLLRREEVSVGDIFRWAKSNQLPYLGAIDLLPTELRERLGDWAHRSLLTRSATFEGSELHRALMTLLLGYQKNYDVVFPKIPVARSLLRYVKELALPLHVHKEAQELCSRLNLEFSFPTRKSQQNKGLAIPTTTKHTLLDIPDTLLAASVVLVTKYMYPFDNTGGFPPEAEDGLTLKMDWAAWEAEFTEPTSKAALSRLKFGSLGPEKIWSISKTEVHEYLNRYQETRIQPSDRDEHHEPSSKIEQLFPVVKDTRRQTLQIEPPTTQALSKEQAAGRMSRVQRVVVAHGGGGDNKPNKGVGSFHQVFRSVDDLNGPAKRFYEKVVEISGLSIHDLVHAVFRLEQMFLKQQAKEQREQREGLYDLGSEGLD
ncbi:hypothetical protein B0H66DRAFT_234157 [Apodospora peruviana]|uniref:RRN7-type domain-containing protein n=1 Tax=Apodospora peruviana TaxID=516989 RepID=A0AAE0I4D2_9PEZI|nr:hypothetical protein B0H66DRAFT_234157 [Apodospora peruviana]